MRVRECHSADAYVSLLAEEARHLQHAASVALEQGHYTRASALISHAELLAEDVHSLVVDIERHDIGASAAIAAYDVRAIPVPAPPRPHPRFTLPSRRIRMALGASLFVSLALAEF